MNHQDTKTPSSFEPIDLSLDVLGREIVDCAYKIHSVFGPGLLESFYEQCFAIALKKKDIKCVSQKSIDVQFMGEIVPNAYKLDLLIEDKIIVELKSVEKLIPLYDAQLMSYMKIFDCRLGYLINFNVPLIKDGIKRKVL